MIEKKANKQKQKKADAAIECVECRSIKSGVEHTLRGLTEERRKHETGCLKMRLFCFVFII